jgi:hypothetical protein
LSQLRVSAQGQQDFYLNVLGFDSPINAEMNSAQTKSQIQYFPIKAFQPDLTCNVIFPSEAQWQSWQSWVRQNMLNTQGSNTSGNPGVTLNWPERSINNWIAIIPVAKAGGFRYNYAPRTQVTFQLITSLVSNLGNFASFGTAWQGLFGAGNNLGGLLNLPANAGNFFGATTPGGSFSGGSFGSSLGSVTGGANINSIINIGSSLTSLIPGVGGLLGGLIG